MLSNFISNLKSAFLAQALRLVVAFFRISWKKITLDKPSWISEFRLASKPFVIATLHEDDIPHIVFPVSRNANVLVSHSKDGEFLSRYLSKVGFKVARGSSSRGAVGGFIQMFVNIKKTKFKESQFAVDGPRGPRRKSKMGAFKMAQKLNAPVVPLVAYASRAWVFKKSWSKAFLPKMGARVYIKYLEAFTAEEIQEAFMADNANSLLEKLDSRLTEAKMSFKSQI